MTEKENLVKVFEYALNQEQTGKSFFQNSLQRLALGAAVTAFKKLIEEEEKHIAFISGIIDGLKREGTVDPAAVKNMVIQPTDFFDQRAKSEFLEQCVIGSMIPDVTVFNLAWLIEKDLSEFYAGMAARTRGPAREALRMLADWEKGHERFFKDFRDQLSETYAQMPWGG